MQPHVVTGVKHKFSPSIVLNQQTEPLSQNLVTLPGSTIPSPIAKTREITPLHTSNYVPN